MIFNLTQSRCFSCLSPSHAICRSDSDGPVFGYDELFFALSLSKSERKCHSDPHGTSYCTGVDQEGKNNLTNSKDECLTQIIFIFLILTVAEFEVWEIFELQPYKKE